MSWFPEIMYEEEDNGVSSKIPFIAVPADQEMPKFLFIFESRETGEFEPGPEGEDLPVVQLDLHQYADMTRLKAGLDAETFDKVRGVLGLEPLGAAASKGAKITQNIRKNLS
jgi:hypothetical protein